MIRNQKEKTRTKQANRSIKIRGDLGFTDKNGGPGGGYKEFQAKRTTTVHFRVTPPRIASHMTLTRLFDRVQLPSSLQDTVIDIIIPSTNRTTTRGGFTLDCIQGDDEVNLFETSYSSDPESPWPWSPRPPA